MNRYFLIMILALLVQANVVKAQHKLEKVWQTDSILKTPESVLFDAKEQLLYVANIDGQPWEKDGKGFISKLDLDGHVLNLHWVTGLHCPKGMTRVNNHLYVADADSLLTIDIISAKVVARSSTTGVEQLNDVTSDKGGRVYVTDSKTGKIYQLKGDALVLLVEGLKGLNGILSASGSLYAVAGGTLYKVEAGKEPIKLAAGMEPATDGIEEVAPNEFLVSVWQGVIYYAKADGTVQTLLDTRADKSNTADIGYNPATRMMYVPTFFKNSVAAYRLR